jgi:hypothetical protein
MINNRAFPKKSTHFVSYKYLTCTGTYKKRYGHLDQALFMLNPKQSLLLFLSEIGMGIFIQTLYLQLIKEICEYKTVNSKVFVEI